MAKARADRPTLGDKERALWSHATRDATPLKRARKILPPEPGPVPNGQGAAVGAGQLRPVTGSSRVKAAPIVERTPLPELAPGAAPGVDRSTAEKLRRGDLAIEGRLDLHGHTQDEAHAALVSFVESARRSRKRCLIVITGKGGIGRQTGVLRAAVPRWLNGEPMRRHILAFASAQPKHGGAGALYVLLRRQR
jgi:DNA-nicking Smr family endonuclease